MPRPHRLPAMPNVHSHAFQHDLRGISERPSCEAAAGDGAVGFPLLPAAYRRAGWDGGDLPASPEQRRFCDPSIDAFLERVDALREWAAPRERVSVGVAAHSVRAVPAGDLSDRGVRRDTWARPAHPRARAATRNRPMPPRARLHPRCAARAYRLLGPRTTLVRGIHVTSQDSVSPRSPAPRRQQALRVALSRRSLADASVRGSAVTANSGASANSGGLPGFPTRDRRYRSDATFSHTSSATSW
jgi:hypothetical protein